MILEPSKIHESLNIHKSASIPESRQIHESSKNLHLNSQFNGFINPMKFIYRQGYMNIYE